MTHFTGPTIVLPADPDYIVQEIPDGDIPPEMLQELCRLGRIAAHCPWRVYHGGYDGQDWLVGTFGTAQHRDENGKVTNKEDTVYLTTDHVHASEVDGDALDDAEWCARVRKLLPKLVPLLAKKVGRQPKPHVPRGVDES